ncbi:MAG: hypothetical protein ACOH1Y_12525 [Propionicimonas sp.]
MALNKDWAKLAKTAEAAGWTVTNTRGGHMKWKARNGAAVFSASTPSDKRAMANHISLLRRADPALSI